MKSTIWKSTCREIRQSLGRYLAILAIVALGVGFFAGLKVTGPAMRETTERYLEKNAFYDYRLLSTVGFTEEDVEVFRTQEDVRAAEGAVTFDILCEGSGGSTRVLKAHSITEEVNRLVVVEGRLPENDSECVVDADLYDASWIGKKIVLSDENDESDLEHFTYREYVVTGIVQSPYYIQFERGNTSLGNGRVSGFLYLLPEGFAVDYYTEVVVKFSEDFPLYDEAYETYIDEKTDSWETLAEQLAQVRYETVLADAEAELADGKKELEEKSADAEAELADAKKTLDEAAEQIADGEEQLAQARKELEEAPEQIAEKEAELTAAEQMLAQKETELDQAEIALGLAYAQGIGQMAESMNSDSLTGGSTGNASGSLQDAASLIAESRKQIADGRAQLDAAKEQIKNGWAALDAAKKELEEGEKTLKEQEKEFEQAKLDYEEGYAEYEEGLAEYENEVADAKQQIADAEEALASLEPPKVYVLGRDTNVGYVCFESDSGIVDGIANIFPVFFFLVAALVCVTTMNRMVEEQRTQIGVWKALGYRESTIMGKYIFYSGSAAVAGCVIGFFTCTWFFPKVIWYAYGMMYSVDSLVYVFDWKLAVISLVVSLLCSIGTTWISCRYELSEVAAELMRPKAPKAGKRVFLERIPFVWNRLKFLQKVSIRNIFRYKKRFFMMIIGISGCTALLVTGFGVRDSVSDLANQQYTEIQIYDIDVTYSEPVGASEKSDLEALLGEGVSDYTFVLEKTVDMEVKEGIKSVSLVVSDGGETMRAFVDLHTTDGETIAYPGKNEAVISNKLATDYDVRIGDIVTLRDEDYHAIEVVVSGICQNFVYNYVYLSADTYTEQMGSAPEYKNVYVNAAEGKDVHLLSTVLMNLEHVVSVSANADIMERFSSMIRSMDLIVIVIILCAAGLAFIVLYNLTNINITERIREVATIEVLGFYDNETCAYVFRENTILALLGALVGLVLGRFLHAFVMSEINIDMVSFDTHILPISYVYSLVLTVVFSWLVHRFMRGKLARISMTESLKSVD